jgi:hypothetical protein
MTVIQTKYTPGRFGLATEFSLSQIPLEYSKNFTNRFINIRGDAEKRQGIGQLGNTVTGAPEMTAIHELVDRLGVSTLFSSANGVIYKYNETTGDWSSVLTGKDASSRLLSVQMGDKLIFVNGVDRNFYTTDGVTFKELKAIVESGTASSTQTTSTSLTDSSVTSWIASTFVTNNDICYNITRNAYGIITSVGATNLSMSPIGSAATGIGFAAENQQSGDLYEIIDSIALNIIPSSTGFDNFATLTAGSSTSVIAVSGVDFSTTEAQTGDYIYNTTRNALTAITAVSANLNVTSVTGQTVNDSITLFKSAMPIGAYPHVHYGSLYLIDARQRGVVRISGPDDPQDFTTNQNDAIAITSFYNTRQPQAEILLSLKTFQQYLVAGGQRNVYADVTTLTSRTSGAATNSGQDFSPVGLFPQGCASRFGLESIGGACVFAANDGLRNFNAGFNANTFQTANVSEVIKSELSAAIAAKSNSPDEIQIIHYPRRNWLLFKVGDIIYNYNYTPSYNAGQITQTPYGSFSKFSGKFAQQKVYYVRRNGDLLCAGSGGKIYSFDKGSYSDDGESISTSIETGFIKLADAQEGTQMKTGVYIKPIFETSTPIQYTITAIGGFDELTTDTISTSTTGSGEVGIAVVGSSPVGGRRIFENKLPLRWRGEEFRIRIDTNSTTGPDIISGYTIYGNILGKV